MDTHLSSRSILLVCLSLVACSTSHGDGPFDGGPDAIVVLCHSALCDSGTVDAATTDAGECGGPSPAGCVSTGCSESEVCAGYELTDECVPGGCACSDGSWTCTADCGGGTCVARDPDVCCGCETETFPVFDKSCSAVDDCVLVLHQPNCCGSMRATGIRATERERFISAEASCRLGYPLCRCAASFLLEDGSAVEWDGATVACIEGQCRGVRALHEGDLCGSAESACSPGLSCCYPCGIPGCDLVCEPSCDGSGEGCSDGCYLRA